MMSPTQQSFGYGYAYSSPQRAGSNKYRGNNAISEGNDARNDSEGGKTNSNSTPQRPVTKQARESPSQAN
jgi:hypothetical protein